MKATSIHFISHCFDSTGKPGTKLLISHKLGLCSTNSAIANGAKFDFPATAHTACPSWQHTVGSQADRLLRSAFRADDIQLLGCLVSHTLWLYRGEEVRDDSTQELGSEVYSYQGDGKGDICTPWGQGVLMSHTLIHSPGNLDIYYGLYICMTYTMYFIYIISNIYHISYIL